MALLIIAALPALAQVPPPPPPPAPSPARVEREVNDVNQTIRSVNDAVNAIKEARRTVDSVVADSKSHIAGEVHFIFLGINYNDENLAPVEEALKELKGITDLQKLQKTTTVNFEIKSSLVPYEIWKDLPKKAQKYFIVHDKDPYNVVLIYRAPPKAKN